METRRYIVRLKSVYKFRRNHKLLPYYILPYCIQLNYYYVKPTLNQSDHKNVFLKFLIKARPLKPGHGL